MVPNAILFLCIPTAADQLWCPQQELHFCKWIVKSVKKFFTYNNNKNVKLNSRDCQRNVNKLAKDRDHKHLKKIWLLCSLKNCNLIFKLYRLQWVCGKGSSSVSSGWILLTLFFFVNKRSSKIYHHFDLSSIKLILVLVLTWTFNCV